MLGIRSAFPNFGIAKHHGGIGERSHDAQLGRSHNKDGYSKLNVTILLCIHATISVILFPTVSSLIVRVANR